MITKREPMFTDAAVEQPWSDIFDAKTMRDVYEAARSKDAELIQMLVDALHGEQFVPSIQTSTPDLTRKALDAAAAAGFKPSEP